MCAGHCQPVSISRKCSVVWYETRNDLAPMVRLDVERGFCNVSGHRQLVRWLRRACGRTSWRGEEGPLMLPDAHFQQSAATAGAPSGSARRRDKRGPRRWSLGKSALSTTSLQAFPSDSAGGSARVWAVEDGEPLSNETSDESGPSIASHIPSAF